MPDHSDPVEHIHQDYFNRLDLPDPIEAIKFGMERLELKPSDLAKILGEAQPPVGSSQQEEETHG
jgi:hypothetical protein